MNNAMLDSIKVGLLLVLLCLLFGVGMGVTFGVNEDLFKDFIAQGIAAHPDVHDEKSADKIWRYAQRAHFHSAGVAAFSLGLLFLVALSGMAEKFKKLAALLIGCGSFYPFAWFTMFFLSPVMGRDPSHAHWLTELFTYVGVGGLLAGMFILLASLFLGLFVEHKGSLRELA
ncbi:MAG: hypothetical protein KJ914_11035 [Gammaproteobacteria bacterium]|nr:hypothetical protein [Gammaproteobacteria bacterium]MBU1722414.1 hypothetical protein [Gammaproteobacteria bacterium]MBU2004649.1 hypothetical protein [Gammaproteobacteria bacterium]